MKEGIHPQYVKCLVTCSCGHTFETRSTAGIPELKLAICGACHPFFTGTQKLVDAQGRVDRFNRRYGLQSSGLVGKKQSQKSAVVKNITTQ